PSVVAYGGFQPVGTGGGWHLAGDPLGTGATPGSACRCGKHGRPEALGPGAQRCPRFQPLGLLRPLLRGRWRPQITNPREEKGKAVIRILNAYFPMRTVSLGISELVLAIAAFLIAMIVHMGPLN